MSRVQVQGIQTQIDEFKESITDGQYKTITEALAEVYHELPELKIERHGPIYAVIEIHTFNETSEYRINHTDIFEEVLSIIQYQYGNVISITLRNYTGYVYHLHRKYAKWVELRNAIVANVFTPSGYIRPLFTIPDVCCDGETTDDDDEIP